ncbi:unnamed protein product [Urochloa humidicola]
MGLRDAFPPYIPVLELASRGTTDGVGGEGRRRPASSPSHDGAAPQRVGCSGCRPLPPPRQPHPQARRQRRGLRHQGGRRIVYWFSSERLDFDLCMLYNSVPRSREGTWGFGRQQHGRCVHGVQEHQLAGGSIRAPMPPPCGLLLGMLGDGGCLVLNLRGDLMNLRKVINQPQSLSKPLVGTGFSEGASGQLLAGSSQLHSDTLPSVAAPELKMFVFMQGRTQNCR